VVERAVILAAGGTLKFELPQLSAAAPLAVEPEADIIQDAEWRRRERANVLAALKKSGFRVSGEGGAAQLLGVNPATLTSRLRALGIHKPNNHASGKRSFHLRAAVTPPVPRQR